MQIPYKPRPVGARKPERSRKAADTTPVVSDTFQSFDDTRIFYSIEGPEKFTGTPLVFCYGLVCSSLHWTYQIDHFKKSHRSVWFDYRGHHNSDAPKDLKSITIANMAKDLGLLLDELKIPKAILIGHSMGSSVALEFYRQQPSRVGALVLSNGTPKRPLETLLNSNNTIPGGFHLLKTIYEKSPKLFGTLWRLQRGNPVVRAIIKMGGFNPHLTPDEDIDRYVSLVEDMDPGIFLQILATYNEYDASSWLHTIQVPTLVISGARDQITPADRQELMSQLIPGSRLEKILHGSHCPQMDFPELINEKIERFLNELN